MEAISKHKISISHEFQTFLVGIRFSWLFFPDEPNTFITSKRMKKNECDFDGIQRKKANPNEY